VLLLGSGLTAIDAALLLQRRGFAGRITAMSRRGLCPRTHDDAQPPVTPLGEKPARELSGLVRSVRTEAARIGWRGAVDALRPVTQLLWRAPMRRRVHASCATCGRSGMFIATGWRRRSARASTTCWRAGNWR
jgi:uncharacterized NAD(P)/FAD-binding protein YdhS